MIFWAMKGETKMKNYTVRYEEKRVIYVDIPAVSEVDALQKFDEKVDRGEIDILKCGAVVGASTSIV